MKLLASTFALLFMALCPLQMWGQGDWPPCDPTSPFAEYTYTQNCESNPCNPGQVIADITWVWTDTYYGTTCDSGQYQTCVNTCWVPPPVAAVSVIPLGVRLHLFPVLPSHPSIYQRVGQLYFEQRQAQRWYWRYPKSKGVDKGKKRLAWEPGPIIFFPKG